MDSVLQAVTWMLAGRTPTSRLVSSGGPPSCHNPAKRYAVLCEAAPPLCARTAWAAESLAMGTRNGEQLT